MSKLKIDDVVQVSVSTSGPVTSRNAFNTGLIIGKSNHITATERVKIYSSLESMLDDGFLATDPEYKAAVLYFGQEPRPQKVVIGHCGADEEWLAAIQTCKQRSGAWYSCYVAGTISKAQHQAIAAYIQTIIAVYFYDDKSADALNASKSDDVFSTLKKLTYKRSCGIYSTTEYAGAALMGFAMGANDGTPGSAYTLFGKTLAGVAPDDLSESDVAALAAKNANYYITRGSSYNLVEHSVTADGTWFDELMGLDQLANDLQISCMDVLTKTKTKVPYTDPGTMRFVLACNDACYSAARRGFIGPGIWTLDSVLDLEKGDTLETGYMCQAAPVADEPAANRGLRICPPIYVCVILTGAIHSVAIKVIVE